MRKHIYVILVILVLLVISFCCREIIGYVIDSSMWWKSEDFPLRSKSMNDAKKRGTYICQVKPIALSYPLNNNITFSTKGGWVEVGWWGHSGHITRIDSERFSIHLVPIGDGSKMQNMIYSTQYGSDIVFVSGEFISEIDKYPIAFSIADSLEYYVLKENKDEFNFKDFSKNHIVDSFYVVLNRKE